MSVNLARILAALNPPRFPAIGCLSDSYTSAPVCLGRLLNGGFWAQRGGKRPFDERLRKGSSRPKYRRSFLVAQTSGSDRSRQSSAIKNSVSSRPVGHSRAYFHSLGADRPLSGGGRNRRTNITALLVHVRQSFALSCRKAINERTEFASDLDPELRLATFGKIAKPLVKQAYRTEEHSVNFFVAGAPARLVRQIKNTFLEETHTHARPIR